MKKILTAALSAMLSACFCTATAQELPEYRLELGGGAGLMAYEGDYNGNPLKGQQPMATLVAKYKMNPRMAWAAHLGYGNLKGNDSETATWYPQTADTKVDFKTGTVDFSVRYEYNFWPFGNGNDYLGAVRLTPFVAIGAGMTFAKCGDTSTAALQMPVGLGVKYKLGERTNLAADWTMHFTGSDKLDGIADPYGIKSQGMFKNTDCYSILQITMTYDLWAKCKTCHNDRD